MREQMGASPSLSELLEIENDPAFVTSRCPRSGFLVWPLIRNQFLRQLISDLYYRQAPMLAPVAKVPARRAAAALLKSLRHNVRQPDPRADVLVLATGAGQIVRNGRGFNRITDYLVEARAGDTVTVEGVVGWDVPGDRWNARVSYWLPWQGAITIAGRVLQRGSHLSTARALVEHARSRAQQLLGLGMSEESVAMLSAMLARKLARLPVMAYAYRRLFEKVRPRLLLAEQACYGDFSPINQIAREMGIRVAEPQHGMVSKGHEAYCYAPALRDSAAYRTCLPDDFLGYGQWWNEQVNAPVQKWVIGHPHYSEQRKAMPPANPDQRDILLLCDGIEFDLYLGLATELAALLRGRYRVVLRPHPLERARVRERYPSGVIGEVSIDGNADIYSSLRDAHVVAGEVSTGLFEAVGLAGRVLLWETPKARFSYPDHPFGKFADAKGFIEAMQGPAAGGDALLQTDVWAADWAANYQRYLEHALANPR